MTNYPISRPEELLEYTLAVTRAKASEPLDQETFDSIIACARHFMSERKLPLRIACNMVDFFLFYSNRTISVEISKYGCEAAEREGNDSFFQLFHEVYGILSGDAPDQFAIVQALYRIKAPFYHKVAYTGEAELIRIIKSLRFAGIDEAIDLGCGFGRVGRILREAGYSGRLTGVDMTRGMFGIGARDRGLHRGDSG